MNTKDRIIDMSILKTNLINSLRFISSQEPDSLGDKISRMTLKFSWAMRTDGDIPDTLENKARNLLKQYAEWRQNENI